MEYAKICGDNVSVYTKRTVRIGNTLIANPTRATMESLGYKPLVEDELPLGGGEMRVFYRDEGDVIRLCYEPGEADR